MTICNRCNERPAVACDECRRALALLDHSVGFGAISRHPEQGTDCRLCERGAAELCVQCLCQGVLDARADPDGPYAAPTPQEFAAEDQRAQQDRERVAEINRTLGNYGQPVAMSLYNRTPHDSGPSWCRYAGW